MREKGLMFYYSRKYPYKNQANAQLMIEQMGKDCAYDLACSLLYELGKENYCVWQTYTKEDIKDNLGIKYLKQEDFHNVQAGLTNFFVDYYNFP